MRRAVTAGLLLLVGATLGVLTVTAGLVNAGSVALLRGLSAPSDQARSAIQSRPTTGSDPVWIGRAESLFDAAGWLGPNYPVRLAGESRAALLAGDAARALGPIEAAARLSEATTYRFEAGRTARAAGERDRALVWWAVAAPTVPDRLRLAAAIFNDTQEDLARQAEDAIAILERTTRETVSPVDRAALFDRIADYAEQAGPLEVAERAAEQAVVLQSDSPDYLARLAWIVLRTGRTARALELSNAAISLGPNWRAHQVRGQIALGNCRLEEAGREFSIALAIGDSSDYRAAWALRSLGEVLSEQGRPEQAEAAWLRYLALQPGDSIAQGWLSSLQAGTLARRCPAGPR